MGKSKKGKGSRTSVGLYPASEHLSPSLDSRLEGNERKIAISDPGSIDVDAACSASASAWLKKYGKAEHGMCLGVLT